LNDEQLAGADRDRAAVGRDAADRRLGGRCSGSSGSGTGRVDRGDRERIGVGVAERLGVVTFAATFVTSLPAVCSVTSSVALIFSPPIAFVPAGTTPVAVIAAVCVMVEAADATCAVLNCTVPALPAATEPVAPPLALSAALIAIDPSAFTIVTTPPLPPVVPPPAADPPSAVIAPPSVISAAPTAV
jgi:hypothetical protein